VPGVAADSSARREATFAPDPGSARLARLAVEEALRTAAVPPAVIADALLVLGEMVSNAIRHARTDFTVCTEISGGILRLEVLDHDTRPPMLMGLDPASTSGRGLRMVSAVAADWGWNPTDGGGDSGKVVWATVLYDTSDT
jgi:anti-sigma regulatory factor (Ser/Thr protein kinase)